MHRLIELAGEIPFNNNDKTKIKIENFCSDNIAVIVTNKATAVGLGTHCHDSYEFVISYSQMPSTIIDDKVFNRTANTLFAVNPMQNHGMVSNVKNFSLCGIHIDKNYLRSVALDIYDSSNIVFSNDSFSVNHDINMLLRLFLEELRYKQQGYEFMVENLSLLIVGNLIRQIKHNIPSRPRVSQSGAKEDIKKVVDYMNENCTSGVSCTELSDLIKMGKHSFLRNFKAQTSKTPYEYLLDLKIEKAKKMLKSNEYNITEISLMCGFSSHSHFTSTFKKKIGMSPSEYRNSP